MRKCIGSSIIGVIAALLLIGAAPPPDLADGSDVLNEFRAVCLDWDGALDLAEQAAPERGYVPSPELVPDDLFQRGGLYVYSRNAEGVHWRLVMKRHVITDSGGAARLIRCAILAEPADLGTTRRAISRFTGLRSFA